MESGFSHIVWYEKNQIFYGKQVFLTVLLAWLALLNEAVGLTLQETENAAFQESQAFEVVQKKNGEKTPVESKEPEKFKESAKVKELVDKKEDQETIRVVLMDSDYNSY